MQIPKNVVQIGTVDSTHKLYIEDYVHIFLKQYNEEAAEFYLYGKLAKEEDNSYYFVYGAVKQDSGEENSCFSNRKRIGEAVCDGKEMWFFLEDGYAAPLEGYFVFYEQNEDMQSYLIAMNQNRPGEKEDTVCSKPVVKRISNPVQKREKEEDTSRDAKKLTFIPVLILLILCAIGINVMNQYPEIRDIVSFFEAAANEQKEEPEAVVWQEIQMENPAEDQVEEQETGFVVEEKQIDANVSDIEEAEPVTEALQDSARIQEMPITITTASYTVKKGDNLAAICRAKYGNTDRIQEIIDLNHLADPNYLYPGQKIILPE